jgi:glycosyltransferase involved in cell wall biosynthesis
VFDLYSCDYDLFNKVSDALDHKHTDYPGYFLFVGRFTHVKGIDILLKAYQIYQKSFGGDWKLICVGNGDLGHLLESEPGIEVKDFANQQELAELCGRSGVFVLPSRHEPWGVVVHEFAAAGLPLLLSDKVGAMSSFFIEGFNGLSFTNNSIEALCEAMVVLSRKADQELWQMGENSRRLASRITPATSAANLISVVPEYRNEGRRAWRA